MQATSSAKHLRRLLVAAMLVFPNTAVAAEDFSFSLGDGSTSALVKAMPKQSEEVQDAVSETLLFESDSDLPDAKLPLDPVRCPTGRVIITAQKQSAMRKKRRQSGDEPKNLAGFFLRGKPGRDCQIWLNARALHRFDESQICTLVRHELGHARGLDHTTTGLMQPIIPDIPQNVGCDWAWNAWVDAE